MTQPLDVNTLRAKLVRPQGPYSALTVVERTGSTNADLRVAAASGAGDGTVLIAEQQTAGQGRRARTWVSPAGTGLYLSVLFRLPSIPMSKAPWLTLIAGLALARTARQVARVDAVVKWPNDLLVGPDRAKCAGVLAEVVNGDAVVLGIGLNVAPLPDEVQPGAGGLPATSLAEQGAAVTDRTRLATALLATLAAEVERWRSVAGDPLASGVLDAYRQHCATLGQQVRVELPGQQVLAGVACDLNLEGQLLVRTADGVAHAVHAGDVIHLRYPHR